MRYSVAVAAAVGAIVLRKALGSAVGAESTAYAAVVVAAWAGGMGPGIVATALCMAGAAALMHLDSGTRWTAVISLRFALFGLSGTLISMLCGSLWTARRRAERALGEAQRVEQDLRRSEAERDRAAAELWQAKDEAERANRAKDQFIAVLSHELRTPLTPVLAAGQMLERGAASPALVAELAGLIRRNVELEVRLIDDLLDVTRATRGKMHLEITTVDAHERVREVVRGCDGECHAKDLRFELELEAKRHHVRADPARLQQVLWNLLKNAIKFSHRAGTIRVRTRDLDGSLELEVIDDGIGIEPGVLPRLFNAFEQGPDITRRFGGLGLGLAVSKQLLVAQGGSIEAHSDGNDRGATVRVRLPLAADEEAHASAPDAPDGGERRVLVVDDHADTTRVMALLLRASGYRVRVAGSVAEATEAARREEFDALISDIGLPDGTGYDLMRLLLAERKLKGIAVSGYGTEDDVRLAREAGFEEHLTKPVNAGKLLEVLGKVVGEKDEGGTGVGGAQAASTAT